jgi:hypothetical protein
MRANLSQASYSPGANMHQRAALTDIGIPLEGSAAVHAVIKYPDASVNNVPLVDTSPGVFEADVIAPMSGIYPVHFYAKGKSLRGSPSTREQLRTGMAWLGGDDTPPSGPPAAGTDWCDLLHCLLKDRGVPEMEEGEQHRSKDARELPVQGRQAANTALESRTMKLQTPSALSGVA